MHGGVQLLSQVFDHLVREPGDSSRKPRPATASLFEWALSLTLGRKDMGAPSQGVRTVSSRPNSHLRSFLVSWTVI